MGMKNLICGIVLAIALVACGGDGDEAYTWGDASLTVSVAYCGALEACGLPPERTPGCEKHVLFHMCGLNDTCETSRDDGLEVQTQLCETDLNAVSIDSGDCWPLYFGWVPDSCIVVLEADPKYDADAGT